MNDHILTVDRVSKRFGALRALDNVSFSVSKDEIVGIAGPNGSGKSTLFNVLTGIPNRPDGGQVMFHGRRIERLSPHQIAQAGLVRTFQTETDFESLSVLDNVLVGVAAHQKSGSHEAHVDLAKHWLDFVGIRGDARRPASELSVFERKLLMIASALALAPKLLLLDEPASGLSRPEVAATTDLILKINELGISLLVVEHVMPLLLAVSQRLIVLNYGEILAEGDPKDVVRDPHVIEAYLGSERLDDHRAT